MISKIWYYNIVISFEMRYGPVYKKVQVGASLHYHRIGN